MLLAKWRNRFQLYFFRLLQAIKCALCNDNALF